MRSHVLSLIVVVLLTTAAGTVAFSQTDFNGVSGLNVYWPRDYSRGQADHDGTAISVGYPTWDLPDDYSGWSATYSCTLDPAGTVFDSNSGKGQFSLGLTKLNWTVTLTYGGSSLYATHTQNVTVVDHAPPTFDGQPLADLTAFQDTLGGATTVTVTTPTASDNCDADVKVVGCVNYNPATGEGDPLPTAFQLGATVVTWLAVDASGNQATATQNVVVSDNTPPIITVMHASSPVANGDTVSVEAGPGGTAAVTWTYAATDNCDADVTPTCAPAPGGPFPIGDTTVTVTADDVAANAATLTFTVHVIDNIPPVISVPAETVTVEQEHLAGTVVTWQCSALDNVDGPVTCLCTPPSGSTFQLGTTQVTCSATDASNNTATATFSVSVVDTTPPVITRVPKDITVEQKSRAGTVVSWPCDLRDRDCDRDRDRGDRRGDGDGDRHGDRGCQLSEGARPDALCAGSSDGHRGPSRPQRGDCCRAQDICDAHPTITCAPASGSTFQLGTTTVLCTAADASGNTSTATFTVTVVDTTPPALVVPADITKQQTSTAGTPVSWTCSATDICDSNVAVVCVPASGSKFKAGTTTVACTATDSRGNRTTRTFRVTIQNPSCGHGGDR